MRELIIPVHEDTRDSPNVHLLCMGAHTLGQLPEEYQVLHNNRNVRGLAGEGCMGAHALGELPEVYQVLHNIRNVRGLAGERRVGSAWGDDEGRSRLI